VQLVVSDTNILFPGLVDEASLSRKLLVLFGWGKLHADLRALEDERAEIHRILDEVPGAEIGGGYDPDALIERTKDKIAAMEERLPAMTPTDFGIVLSSPLIEELEDNMQQKRSELGNLTKEQTESHIASVLTLASTFVVEGFDGPIPDYTEGRDPKDDPIIHTAVLAGADWIVSRDTKHIALDRKKPTVYVSPETGRHYPAITYGYFIREVLCSGLHFDSDKLKEIDGSLLSVLLTE
jgi:predicted nucleic acid-binding protein